jgi:type II secretory pathway predicted ATPase ExeA
MGFSLDVVRSVAKGLRDALAEEQKRLEAAKKIVDFLSNWEVLGFRYHKSDIEIDPEDICDQLVIQIVSFCSTLQNERDGILLLLDEADQPPSSANLGKFCKYFTERLTKKGCESLSLGIAGLPIVLDRLRESHESSPRLFDIVHLEPLEVNERKQVVQIGLESANKKNEQPTNIAELALKQIAELSEGYPHFVQQFAHSAFDTDDDNHIDVNDVSEGAYRENGAIAQLGKKYFDSMYFGRIGSDDYRTVLNTMAIHGDEWLSRKQIITESKLKATTVSNALNALEHFDI